MSYDKFFGRRGVREVIKNTPSEERADAVVREYCISLRELCNFKYLSSAVVLQPDKRGIKYFLVFGTNNPMGIKVFKEAEAHAAQIQEKLKFEKEFQEQVPLFSSEEITPVCERLRSRYKAGAFRRVESMFVSQSSSPYAEVFCKAMAMPLVTEDDLLNFIENHPRLKLILGGVRRKKPNIQKTHDRVVLLPN